MDSAPIGPGSHVAGKYRIESILGEGGHGLVFSAIHLALGERVAIKVMHTEIAKDEQCVARFLREARAAVRIKGEHVTRVLDVGSFDDGAPYMVMEHLSGSDLGRILERGGVLPVGTAVDYVLQACDALAEAHALGIVHRDIKPSNLFLTTRSDGAPVVKVLDFGISKAEEGTQAANLTSTQTVMGSPQYMAPEQMRSSRKADARTDIWALGTTLYEILVGAPPFEAGSLAELFAMILQDPTPSARRRRPDIPEALDATISKCLEKLPDHRFPSIAQLAHALAPFASDEGRALVGRIERAGRHRASMPSLPLLASTGSLPVFARNTPSPAKPSTSRSLVAVGVALFVATSALVGALAYRERYRVTPARVEASTAPSIAPASPVVGESSSAIVAADPLVMASAPPQAVSAPISGTRPRSPARPRASVSTTASPAPVPAPTPTTIATGVSSSRYD